MRRLLLIFFLTFSILSLFAQSELTVAENIGSERTLLTDTKEPEIKIFPVPVINNHFTITSDTPFKNIRMTNIIGQEITREKLNYPVSRREVEFKGTQKGIYLVTIELEDSRKIVRKILVENGR